MPILIVSNGPDAVSVPEIVRLASQAEAVVAIDGGGHLCLEAGITPVLVVGDLDSLADETATTLRERGVEFSVHPALKDRSDLDLALEVVADRWGGEVVLTGALGGRLDHTLASLGSIAMDRGLAIDVVESSVDAWVLQAQGRDVIDIEGDQTVFSVFSTAEATVSIEGAFWPLSHRHMDPLSSLGLSNKVEGPRATVRVEEGAAVVLRPRPIEVADV